MEENNEVKDNGKKTRLIIVIISAVAIFVAAASIIIFSIPTFKMIDIKKMFGGFGSIGKGGMQETSSSPVKMVEKPIESKTTPTEETKSTEEKKDNSSVVPTSKCNSGYVYVSDDNRCYSNTDTKPQINRCESGEVDLGVDCGKKVDSALCESSSDYQEINGVCVELATLHNKSMECPSGYEILFGLYDGKEFNGACYRNVKPNY